MFAVDNTHPVPMKTALFPGSFDPFTEGHHNIVLRTLKLFDIVIIAVGINTDKQYMFSPEERLNQIRQRYANNPHVHVVTYSGMTVDLCRQLGASVIVRGVRNLSDMQYEQTVAAVNRAANPEIDTVILFADESCIDISSTLERERLSHQS